ncbi:BRCA1-associated protein 2-domain-containing protein [Crepidotus variabilis]|uniref:BRCA1-associated protein 2-domain-containing protein n=1 Tax=Crepidotus variabilis TaxID=179855 RepID=A0A9P6EMF1_9AGAR|nr:BRCA1-associated protein 2-domain-containing protein [Crepidotus variabilis]
MKRGYHIKITLNPQSKTRSYSSAAGKKESQTFIPASLFQPLPGHHHGPTSSRFSSVNQKNTGGSHSEQDKDYRFGPISLDWVDFDRMGSLGSLSASMSGGSKEKGRRGPAEATYIPHTRQKSGSTNLPEGVVHVFRDGASRPSISELEAQTATLSLEYVAADDSDGIMLGVLAVPSWMTPSDFLTFVAPAVEGIGHLRIIRDAVPNRSMVVIKFLNPAAAAEFAEEYNGKPFNSMEPEICHVVHVLSVVIDVEDTLSQTISKLASGSSGSQTGMYELPTCPVCLERMDSAVTGLITVPCSHTFHCMCLSKWGDSRCPVCRYSQTLLSSHPPANPSSRLHNSSRHSLPFSSPNGSQPTASTCVSCQSTTNLWICLICGNIGCGRYGQAHAQAHYHATTHLYALELETQRVWDYAGDGYVHRLIQNKADGKLVELPSAAASVSGTAGQQGEQREGMGPSQADALSAEKIEAIGIEYSYLLTSQLDSQREYYEEQMGELRVQVVELKELMEKLSDGLKYEQARGEEESRKRKADADHLITLTKEKQKAENRADKMTELAKRLEKELKEERAVSAGLMSNLGKLRVKGEEDEKEKKVFEGKVKELEDQVRDVMFFLDAQKKIVDGEGVESEAAGGSIEVLQTQEPEGTDKLNGKKKKKKKKG